LRRKLRDFGVAKISFPGIPWVQQEQEVKRTSNALRTRLKMIGFYLP
jgi:hypothetical protein